MDKEARVVELLKNLMQNKGQLFFTAEIVSIEKNTCTIKVDNLTLSDVRLKPTTDQLEDDIILTPAVGSSVLVGSFSGDFSNLFVLQSDTISAASLKIGSISVNIDKNGIVCNDGKNGGTLNINELISWMNNVAADMKTIATGLAAVPYTFVPVTQPPNKTSLEDTKVTH
jgi:hypothetical protein